MGKKKAVKELVGEWVDIGVLKPWDLNPRVNDHAVERIAASITEFGWGEVIVVRKADNRIIGGHTRYKAAQLLGLTMVPVRYMDLDEDRASKLAIALNKLGEIATWDDAVLAKLVADMDADTTALIGFNDAEIEALGKLTDDSFWDDGGTDPDKIDPYDPASETYVIKVVEVSAADKDAALAAITSALSAAGLKYEAKAY